MKILEKIYDNQIELINTIKLLIYKENQSLLEKVDFEDDDVFLQPLLFSYFNSKKDNPFPVELLEEIIQGYFIEKQEIKINHSFNNQNIAYIPKIGYYQNEENNFIESIVKIKNTNIEVLKYPTNLLKNIFRTTSGNLIEKEEIIIDENLFEKNIIALSNAFKFIKENSSEQYKLIEQCCKSCIMFKTNPINTNSFATINAHGMAFFNVYQDDYDEVFFIDDIAHQTGHIILTTLFYNRKMIFKIDENQNIGEILNTNDYRSFYTLFHALYTYYTTLICLDDCLKGDFFSKKQQNEAIARIGFYINKCTIDINNFEAINTHFKGIENTLTLNGGELFTKIKEKYLEIFEKWNPITSKYNFINQTYNFSFSIFAENNKNNL
jgi:hypothetical protein